MNSIDISQTKAFLKLLGKTEYVCIQTFDDRQSEKGKRPELTAQFFGKFEDFEEKLIALNSAGAGVFIMVNDPIEKSTRASAVRERTAHFADSDNGPRDNFPICPTLKVKTGNGYHYYWLLGIQCPIDGFEKIQRNIANLLETDSAVSNRNRLMRLPGFFHKKNPDNPILVTIEEINTDCIYELKDVEQAFQPIDKDFPIPHSIDGKWEIGERNNSLYKYIKQNQAKLPSDTSEEKFFEFIEKANQEFCVEPLPKEEVKQMALYKFKEFIENGIQNLKAFAPTLSELLKMNFKPKEPLVDKLIFKRQLSIIGARPKVGKSTLIRYMISCIVDRKDFLGRATYDGSVLYLGMEELLEDVRQDFIDMNIKYPDKIRVTNLENCNSAKEYNQQLELLTQVYKPSLVVIDTMVHLLNVENISEYTETSVALKRFRKFAENHNCHVLLIHHNRKGEGNGNDSLLGSTGIAGAVDLIMDIKTDDDGNRNFITQGRSSQDHFEKTCLNFDKVTKSFFIDKNYNPEMNIETKILEVIKDYRPKSIEVICKHVTGRTSTISKIVKKLIKEKKIHKSTSGYGLFQASEKATDLT